MKTATEIAPVNSQERFAPLKYEPPDPEPPKPPKEKVEGEETDEEEEAEEADAKDTGVPVYAKAKQLTEVLDKESSMRTSHESMNYGGGRSR